MKSSLRIWRSRQGKAFISYLPGWVGGWFSFGRPKRNRIDGLARCPRTPTDSVQRVDRYNGSRDRAALI